MKRYRDVGGHGGLSNSRYKRYCDAFDRVEHCIEKEYFLEAIIVLESLIWDRVSSRLGYLKGTPIDVNKASSTLCSELIGDDGKGGCEHDAAFRDAVFQIKNWLIRRNDAVHATAKVFRGDTSDKDFSAILKSHKKTAVDGIKHLQAFDELDSASRAIDGKHPASSPNAFFPKKRRRQSR